MRYHCVAFGEGISATAPVLIKLNDSDEFRREFLSPRIGELRSTPVAAPPPASPEEEDDEIPF
jgi:hypothetical protein